MASHDAPALVCVCSLVGLVILWDVALAGAKLTAGRLGHAEAVARAASHRVSAEPESGAPDGRGKATTFGSHARGRLCWCRRPATLACGQCGPEVGQRQADRECATLRTCCCSTALFFARLVSSQKRLHSCRAIGYGIDSKRASIASNVSTQHESSCRLESARVESGRQYGSLARRSNRIEFVHFFSCVQRTEAPSGPARPLKLGGLAAASEHQESTKPALSGQAR